MISCRCSNTLTGNELRQKLRQWLSPPDPSVNYNAACSLHHEGTAKWFTQGPVFREWKESGSLLWIHGNRTLSLALCLHSSLTDSRPVAGSGKSVLRYPSTPTRTRFDRCNLYYRISNSSAIISNVKRIANIHVAYFFFVFSDKGKQECRGLLSSILHQLCDQSLPCLDILSRLYSTHHHGSEQPNDNALRQCLRDMLTIAGQAIYLVVDALDESPDTHGAPSSRRKVLDLVKELVRLKCRNLRLCVTSRDEMDIRTVLQPLGGTSLSLHDQKGQHEDIVDYVTFVISSDPELDMRGWQEEDKELVITTLSKRACGMWECRCLTCILSDTVKQVSLGSLSS